MPEAGATKGEVKTLTCPALSAFQMTWNGWKQYRICGNFRGLPIFAVFRGQYDSAKIKTAKYFPISSSLEATSIFAAVTRSFPLLH